MRFDRQSALGNRKSHSNSIAIGASLFSVALNLSAKSYCWKTRYFFWHILLLSWYIPHIFIFIQVPFRDLYYTNWMLFYFWIISKYRLLTPFPVWPGSPSNATWSEIDHRLSGDIQENLGRTFILLCPPLPRPPLNRFPRIITKLYHRSI